MYPQVAHSGNLCVLSIRVTLDTQALLLLLLLLLLSSTKLSALEVFQIEL